LISGTDRDFSLRHHDQVGDGGGDHPAPYLSSSGGVYHGGAAADCTAGQSLPSSSR
jgi:hypothetical protein